MPRHGQDEGKFKPFATYDAEGDTFTLHFYLGKEIGGGVTPCLRCGQTMSGYVGTLGICSGGPQGPGKKSCNQTIFPYLPINKAESYHDWEVTPDQLTETFKIAAKYLDPNIDPPPDAYEGWNHTGLGTLRRLIISAMGGREAMRQATQADVPICAECGFKEPCSCAIFKEVTECQSTTQ